MINLDESQYLSTLPLFSVLNDDQRRALTASCRRIRLTKEQILFNAGDQAESFFLLKSGQVKICLNSAQGVEKVLDVVRPGKLFAEAVMFLANNRYPATAIALKDSEVISFNNQLFTGYLRESTELSMILLGDLSRRLHQKVNEIDSLTLQNATIRVINYLINQVPDPIASEAKFELDTPKQTIASVISVTPETFSRILKQLGEQGLVELSGKSVFIPNIKQLKEFVYSQS